MLPLTIVKKGWGEERWVLNHPVRNYCGKLLHVKEGKKCSWHYHEDKDEAFYVQEGKIHLRHMSLPEWRVKVESGKTPEEALREANSIILRVGEAFHVPPYTLHQFSSLEGDSLVIEFSTFHRDEDSIRVIKGD